MEVVDVALLRGRRTVQPPWPLDLIEDSWLAPGGRGAHRRTEVEGSNGGGRGSGGRDRENKRDIAEDERGGRGEEGREGARGRRVTAAESRGVERRYENGVREKKKSYPAAGQIIGKTGGGTERGRQPRSGARRRTTTRWRRRENGGAGKGGGVAPRQFRTRVQRSLRS